MENNRNFQENIFGLTENQKEKVIQKMGENPNKIFFTWQGLQTLLKIFGPQAKMEDVISSIKSSKENPSA